MNQRIKLLCMISVILLISCKNHELAGKSNEKVYTNLKKALRNKDDVKILSLYGKNLSEFPIEILEFKNLTILNLTNNRLATIPKEIEQLKKLERIELMKNEIASLPQEIGNLQNLRRLNIAYNLIRDEDVDFIRKKLPDCLVITEIIL